MQKTTHYSQEEILSIIANAQSRVIAVSRHPGAIQWLKKKLPLNTMIVSHLDEQLIEKGDIVVGTLPIHIVAQVCAKQAHYYHLTLNLSECHRGKELTVDELESLGATLKSYFAESL